VTKIKDALRQGAITHYKSTSNMCKKINKELGNEMGGEKTQHLQVCGVMGVCHRLE